MKVIVIPDIHLKPWIFDRADEIMKKEMADRAVCLMNIADDWGMELHIKRYEESYDRAIAFAKADRKSTRLNSSHNVASRMPSSA